MKNLFGIVLMLMFSMVTSADELVKFDTNEFTGGTVKWKSEKVVSDEGVEPVIVQVTITVEPASGYYITKDDIVVMATYPLPPTPENKTRADEDGVKKPEFVDKIALEGDDPQKLTEERDYTFTIEKGFGAWVTEANFHQAETSGEIGTVKWSLKADEAKAEDKKLTLTLEGEGTASLDGSAPWAMQLSDIASVIVGKDVTALGAGLFNGCDNLTSVEIQRDESVITLGVGAIPANKGLTVDVPGNIYNMYKMNDSWSSFTVDSKNAVKMGKVKFVKDKNQFDVYVSDKNQKIPVGVSGYTITGVQGDQILYKKVDIITAGEPLLLFSDKIISDDLRTVDLTANSRTREGAGEEVPVVDFALKVVTKDPEKKDEDQGLDVKLGQVYMLYNDVFYPTQAGRIPVGGIYLEEVKKEESKVRGFARLYLSFYGAEDDDAITAIESSKFKVQSSSQSEAAKPSAKSNDSWYDLSGRRLNTAPTAKGVYINGGKKYIIK